MSWNKHRILGALLAFAALAPLRADVTAGAAFPALASAGLAGDLPATAGKVLLVDFWASWCAPCKASFPAYARLQAAYAARGLVIVAVSVDDDPAAYAAFVKKFAPPFATVRDTTQQLVRTVDVHDRVGNVVGSKDVVLYAGLLNQAHEEGLLKVCTSILQIPTEENGRLAIVKAEVQTAKGLF